MKSVDTNILVRLIVGDNAEQAEKARVIVQAGIFVPLTVLLELGWVLSSFYQFGRQQLAASVIALLDNETVHVEDELALRYAMMRYSQGGDFADHIHLVASKSTEAFVTFDQGVVGDERLGLPIELV